MSRPVGLVTGFEPFAGLDANPAERVLEHLDGAAPGFDLVTARIPVSLVRTPAVVSDLLAQHRPAFVLGLGLAAGSAVIRVEMLAVNAVHLAVPDNDGAAPLSGEVAPGEPAARRSTLDGPAVVSAVEGEGIPARLSFHAGTHLCNATLFTCLSRLEDRRPAAPCGFLHLPYLPEQVVGLRRRGGAWEQPSMALADQVRAVRAAIAVMAGQVAGA